jgi:hypothetical protein
MKLIEGITKNLYPDRDINDTIISFSANSINRDTKQVFKDVAGEEHFDKMFSSFGYNPSYFFLNTKNGHVCGIGVGRNNDLFKKGSRDHLGYDLAFDSEDEEYKEDVYFLIEDIKNIISDIANLHYESSGTPSHEYLLNNGVRCEKCDGDGCEECDDEGWTKESIEDRDKWESELNEDISKTEKELEKYFPNMKSIDSISPYDW